MLYGNATHIYCVLNLYPSQKQRLTPRLTYAMSISETVIFRVILRTPISIKYTSHSLVPGRVPTVLQHHSTAKMALLLSLGLLHFKSTFTLHCISLDSPVFH